MIERYTIKFGPAVSQKELEKALHEPMFTTDEPTAEVKQGDSIVVTARASRLHAFKARIEVICDFEDLKKLSEILREMKEGA
jgi:hypothetical protein